MTGLYRKEETPAEVYDISALGEGLRLLESKKIELNHQAAIGLLEMAEFVADRPLKQRHVNYLVSTMIRGTFRSEWVTIITCVCKQNVKAHKKDAVEAGVEIRMNGQHTAWARLEMPKTYRCPVTKMKYEAETEADVRRLYSSIDRSSPRTNANVVNSYLNGTEEFAGSKHSSIAKCASGLRLYLWPDYGQRRKHDGDDLSYLMLTEHYDICLVCCKMLDACTSNEVKFLKRSGVVAAMLATLDKAPKVAVHEFWEKVKDGTEINSHHDPRLKLRNTLMQTGVDVRLGHSPAAKRLVGNEQIFVWCIKAWNAFRTKQPIKRLIVTENLQRPKVHK